MTLKKTKVWVPCSNLECSGGKVWGTCSKCGGGGIRTNWRGKRVPCGCVGGQAQSSCPYCLGEGGYYADKWVEE